MICCGASTCAEHSSITCSLLTVQQWEKNAQDNPKLDQCLYATVTMVMSCYDKHLAAIRSVLTSHVSTRKIRLNNDRHNATKNALGTIPKQRWLNRKDNQLTPVNMGNSMYLTHQNSLQKLSISRSSLLNYFKCKASFYHCFTQNFSLVKSNKSTDCSYNTINNQLQQLSFSTHSWARISHLCHCFFWTSYNLHKAQI